MTNANTKPGCPAACPCRTADPRNERALADDGLAVCASCREVRHTADVATYLVSPRLTRTLCRVCAVELGLAEGEDEPATVIEPYQSLAELVFGGLRAAVVLLGLALGGCHATAPRVEVETVGTLVPSYGSVSSAPVARSTDLSRGSFVASDDDADADLTPVGEAVEVPDVAPKSSLVMGGVR
jgi:hypothetical protein